MKWLAVITILLLVGCENKPEEKTSVPHRKEMQRPLMGTLFRVVTYVDDDQAGQKAMDDAFQIAADFAVAATDYEANSELNRLCISPAGTPVKLSEHLFGVLSLAHQLAIDTRGIYDPTLGPLTHLWRSSKNTGSLPSEDVLATARDRCGYRHLSLDPENQTATLSLDGMQLDLGGIAKGYAADLIFDHLKKAGYSQTLVAAAGDLRLGDAPPDKEGWGIALRTFKLTPSKPMFLKNCAISTSGDLYQNVQIGEEKYSHLIDPTTGLGLNSRRAASVIAPFAQLTDPLATAACLMDDPAGLTKIRPNISLRVLYEDTTVPPVVTGVFLEN
ncbi:FAD:protein FMN transferase [Akkermansiaceae bacterium]|nr:FAD:protein FMN transferase [Akkermansiaceae bacterium]